MVDWVLPRGIQTYDNLRYWANPILAEIFAGVSAAATVTYVDAQDAAEAAARAAADALLLVKANNLSDLASPATARGNLGLGGLAVLNTINGSNWAGLDLAIADGGTGASTAGAARNNLGLAIGADVQAYSANLTTFAAIAPSANVQTLLAAADFAAFRASLGLGTVALLASDTDGTLAANSDARVATQKAVKTYVDAAVGGGGYTDEQARDAIGAALVAGIGVTITVNDPGNTITIDASGAGSTDYGMVHALYGGM